MLCWNSNVEKGRIKSCAQLLNQYYTEKGVVSCRQNFGGGVLVMPHAEIFEISNPRNGHFQHSDSSVKQTSNDCGEIRQILLKFTKFTAFNKFL